jgi:hypothetical protein
MSLLESVAAVKVMQGKRFASGVLDAASSGDETVSTGLRTVDHAGVTLAGTGPSTAHFLSIAEASATEGSIRIRSYKPTATGDATPIAAISTVDVAWWAIGT